MVNCRKSLKTGCAIALATIATGLIAAGCPGGRGHAQTIDTTEQAVPFDADHWVLGAESEIVSFGGRTALRGTAQVKGVNLRNGTVETDIWSAEGVNFAGLSFHQASFEDHQLIWFRIHKTNGLAPDAVQYAPAHHGVFCWQLNPQANAAVNLPKNEWVHLKLVILNGTASLYVKDMTRPVMTVEPLRPGPTAGSVGLWTLSKGEIYFSNFTYREGEGSELPSPRPIVAANVVSDWRLSPSYSIPTLDAVPTAYPAREVADVTRWIVPEVDGSGLVNISMYHGTRFHGRPGMAGGRPDWTMLRTFIDARQARRVKMNFGYSDAVTIFLNGRALFTGNAAFLSRNGLDSEWIGFNDAVFLDLEAGRNELLAVVAEDFGGWGFQAKLADVEGIRIRGGPE